MEGFLFCLWKCEGPYCGIYHLFLAYNRTNPIVYDAHHFVNSCNKYAWCSFAMAAIHNGISVWINNCVLKNIFGCAICGTRSTDNFPSLRRKNKIQLPMGSSPWLNAACPSVFSPLETDSRLPLTFLGGQSELALFWDLKNFLFWICITLEGTRKLVLSVALCLWAILGPKRVYPLRLGVLFQVV